MVSPKSLVFRSTIFSAVHRTIKLYEQGDVPQSPRWIQTFIILAQITNTKTPVPSYEVVLLPAQSSFRFTLLHHRRLFEFRIQSHPSSSPYSLVLFPILRAVLLILIVFTHLSSIPSRHPSFLTSTTRLLSVATITFYQPYSSRDFVYLTPLLRLPTHLPIILSSYYSQSHPSASISTRPSQSFLQPPISSSSRHPHSPYLQHYVYHTLRRIGPPLYPTSILTLLDLDANSHYGDRPL
ncbi:hypothetical protein BDN70DRAFT_935651 [Pholiota conissans]|uniref:Uncharacterized protein n=1 Tax=Pholiota conissans TaxID=109636 RepID=A0A9P6CQE5_9AGAR|nr:hypothetical protein BDN70DRAFT_935651 [Pholiota conissans]